jgi:hypothetical protein
MPNTKFKPSGLLLGATPMDLCGLVRLRRSK